MVTIVQTLLNGISNGGVYCLVAVGLTMIVGVLKAVNFAQGDCLTIGMYLTLILQRVTGWDPFVLLIPVALLTLLIGMGLFEVIIYPVMEKDKTTFTITTMGMSFVISTVILLMFGSNPLNVNSVVKTTTLTFGAFSIAAPRVASFIVMGISVIALNFFLRKTDLGRAMRATAENKDVGQMLGIDTHKISRITFSLGIMFASVAGLLISPTYYLYPTTGSSFMIPAMCCVVIGGLGDVRGAVVGGMMIGILEALIGTFISVDLSAGAAFLLLILVLIFKPNGLLGSGERIA